MLKSRNLVAGIGTALALAGASTAHSAVVVFYDNFSTVTPIPPVSPGYETVTSFATGQSSYTVNETSGTGNVDIVDDSFGGFNLCESAYCIDLDGTASGSNAYLYTDAFVLNPTDSYQLTVRVSGNGRIGSSDNFGFGFLDAANVNFPLNYPDPGAFSIVTGVANNSPYTDYSITYTPNTATARLFVQNVTSDAGGIPFYAGFPPPDDNGNMLQSITLTNLTAVPLPAAAWLLLSGLAGVGAIARRRKAASEAVA